jgi:hypothetical protein
VRDRLRVSQSSPHIYFRHAPCLNEFTFEFIRRPIPPILSPSYWTFVELTLVNWLASLIGKNNNKGLFFGIWFKCVSK